MRIIEFSEYGEQQFLRLTGVNRWVFELMVELMVEVVGQARRDFGRPRKLSVADQMFLALCYWREYRSQFHIGSSFSVSEATACRTIKAVEEILLGDKRFHLAGKKTLHDDSLDLMVIVVDASEQRVERPKKNSAAAIPARKSAIPKKDKS